MILMAPCADQSMAMAGEAAANPSSKANSNSDAFFIRIYLLKIFALLWPFP
jgi:hypothetical protein